MAKFQCHQVTQSNGTRLWQVTRCEDGIQIPVEGLPLYDMNGKAQQAIRRLEAEEKED